MKIIKSISPVARNGDLIYQSNYEKRGCFVISKVTLWGVLMQKGKKKHKKICLNAK